MVCTADMDYKCGNAWLNSVYDITGYESSDGCADKAKVDCSSKGGYDPKDPC